LTFTYFICFQIAATEMIHQRPEAASYWTWGSISQNIIDKAVGQWKKRLRASLEVKVKLHHFEHLLK